ncbi:hypothetical protein [Microbacterium sp.]|uniref:hypothetical protein n=1 Tax=Microbacterium sp. TaxID=51671 RepID=UPI0028120731|nr:hypothetical protein [Microbacterium sp.]
MRYLLRTGLLGAISTGFTLLRGTRDKPITWRAALGWLSWAITLALAIGAVSDLRRQERGLPVAVDSPFAPKPDKKTVRKTRRKEVARIAAER